MNVIEAFRTTPMDDLETHDPYEFSNSSKHQNLSSSQTHNFTGPAPGSKSNVKKAAGVLGLGIAIAGVVAVGYLASQQNNLRPNGEPGSGDFLLGGTFEVGDDGFTNRGECEAFDVNPNVQPPYSGGRVYPVMGDAVDIPFEEYLEQAATFAFAKVEGAVSYGSPGIIAGSLNAGGDTCPDYFATWARDQALAFSALLDVYGDTPSGEVRDRMENHLMQYVSHSNALLDINPGMDLGEPKFLMTGQITPEQWCRPQRDGPASRSFTLMKFAEEYIKNKGESVGKQWVRNNLFPSGDGYQSNSGIKATVKRDLDYLASQFNLDGACDIWEEVRGHHFYTRLVQRRALLKGVAFAEMMGDTGSSGSWKQAADQLTTILDQNYYDSGEGTIYTGFENGNKYRRDDIQTSLAINHAHDPNDDFFDHSDERVLANAWYTIYRAEGFGRYTINAINWKDEPDLGVALGRYTMNYEGADLGDYWGGEQGNDGCAQNEHLALEVCPQAVRRSDNYCSGQPWFLATNGMTELLYRVALEYKKAGSITVTSSTKPFWTFFGAGEVFEGQTIPSTFASGTEGYSKLMTLMVQAADSFLKRTRYHTNKEFRLDEQYNGITGIQSSAGDLTWSYASLMTALKYRNEFQPRATLESFTPSSNVMVQVVVTNIPVSARNVWIGTSSDACDATKAYLRREQTRFGKAEWSAFVTIPAASDVTLTAFTSTAGCASASSSEQTVSYTSGSKNPVQPLYIRYKKDAKPCDLVAWNGDCGGSCGGGGGGGGGGGSGSLSVTFEYSGMPSNANYVVVTGNQDNLGNWDCSSAPQASKVGDKWVLTVNLNPGDLEFKAIFSATGDCSGAVWENDGGSNQFVNLSSDVTLQLSWTPVYIEVYNVPSNAQMVRIVGNQPALGEWNCDNGAIASKQGDVWKATTALSPGSVEFKAVMSESGTCDGITWMSGSNLVTSINGAGQTLYANWV